jgi:hypothetical protein
VDGYTKHGTSNMQGRHGEEGMGTYWTPISFSTRLSKTSNDGEHQGPLVYKHG